MPYGFHSGRYRPVSQLTGTPSRSECEVARRVDKHLQGVTFADNIKHYRLCKTTSVGIVRQAWTTGRKKTENRPEPHERRVPEGKTQAALCPTRHYPS